MSNYLEDCPWFYECKSGDLYNKQKAHIKELETRNEKLRGAINNFPSVAVCAALTSWGIGLSFSENINELITACANFANFKQALEDS